jgi:hypothetical protein
MPEAEANIILAMDTNELKTQEISFANRQEEQDVARRLNTLFGAGKDAADQEGTENKEFDTSKLDYETVDEGHTSDTTEFEETEALKNRRNDAKTVL